jgi:hypothetical protein
MLARTVREVDDIEVVGLAPPAHGQSEREL